MSSFTDEQFAQAASRLALYVQDRAEKLAADLGFGWVAVDPAPNVYPALKEAWDRSHKTGEPLPITGLSINEVGRRAHVDTGTVWRIEQGMIAKPTAKSLMAIGEVLSIRPIDLFSVAGWIAAEELPSLGTYLRTKFTALPDEAVREIQSLVKATAHKHGVEVEVDPAAVSAKPAQTPTKEGP